MHVISYIQFKVDRLQIIVVAKKYIHVSQLFISRMPKMGAIPQLVSAPLNPIPIGTNWKPPWRVAWAPSINIVIIIIINILGGATHRVSTVADNIYKWGK